MRIYPEGKKNSNKGYCDCFMENEGRFRRCTHRQETIRAIQVRDETDLGKVLAMDIRTG